MHGRHIPWAALVGLSLLATACVKSAPAPEAAPTATQVTTAAVPAQAWQRPLDVKPLPAAGIFTVVSETPSPGAKVPLFFMGAQG